MADTEAKMVNLSDYDVDRIDVDEFPALKEFEDIIKLLCNQDRDWPGSFRVMSIQDGIMRIQADRYWETNITAQSYVPIYPTGYLSEYFLDDEEFGRALLSQNNDAFLAECDRREEMYADTRLRCWAKDMREYLQHTTFNDGDVSLSDPYSNGSTLLWVDLDIKVTRENSGQVDSLMQKFVEIFGQ
jgi:hypothetical protein